MSLLQAWSSDPFSFNGVAWFVSALMFCYFMSMLLMPVLKKSRYVIAATFVGCYALRIALELGIENDVFGFSIDFHVSPIIRCMEFFMGMLMVPAYYTIKRAMDCKATGGSEPRSIRIMVGTTVTELFVSICYLFLMYHMEGRWIRGYFVVAACALVFTYALNAGALSRVL